MGLTIAQRLVGLMGGRIWLQSEPGKGSIFRFTARFGLQTGQAEELRPPAASREALRELPVLVVAENPTSGRILVETLRRWSMKPEMADDVPAALAKVHQAAGDGQSFRLVLADAVMPGLDSFSLARQLRSDARLAGPVILMLSASQRRSQAKRCQDLGALCLEKPISQSALLHVIAEALDIPQQAARTADVASSALSPVASRALRVLLAEDTPANQKLVSYVLNKRGHSVEVVHNGQQALEAAGRQDFDVVLMDVQMPVMDGFQATRAIRKLHALQKARLPIIAMTAHALKGDHERCVAAGMDGYISKPIKGGELIEMVERLAEKRLAGKTAEGRLEPVQELFRVFRAGSRADGVVPLRTDGMAGELNGFELGVADTLTGLVGLLKVRRRHLQPRPRRRAADEPQQHRERAQHESRPGCRDLAEQPMLNGVPLQRPRRIMAHRDFQPVLVPELSQISSRSSGEM